MTVTRNDYLSCAFACSPIVHAIVRDLSVIEGDLVAQSYVDDVITALEKLVDHCATASTRKEPHEQPA